MAFAFFFFFNNNVHRKLLISAGANTESVSEPLAVDESEATPVTFAREAGNMRLVRMLMDPLRR